MLSILVFAAFLAYCFLVGLLILGWKLTQAASARAAHSRDNTHSRDDKCPSVSVVVAARNESRRIGPLLDDLQRQQYDNFEVIIVDDHSGDDTGDVCRTAVSTDSRFRVIAASGIGKKAALSQGVNVAHGVLILTTDADCRVGPRWIRSMTETFEDPSVRFCFGCVVISGEDLFSRMQALEFASLIGAGVSTAALGAPTMCNGANLAYTTKTFGDVGGYGGNESVPSGDDEFLMRKVNAAYPGSIRICRAYEALVTTEPSPDVRTFFEQRIRWAGKWRLSKDPTSTLLALVIFLFHCLVAAMPLLVITGNITVEAAIVALSLKAVAEFVYIKTIQRGLDFRWSWTAFLMLQVVYSYYVIIVAGFAQFIGFEWKGRRLRPSMAGGH